MSQDISGFIERYVQQLRDARSIRSDAVARAFGRVRRDLLLETIWMADKDGFPHLPQKIDSSDPKALEFAFSDTVFFTCLDADGRPVSSSTRPALHAQMLEMLDLRPGMQVLEIGTGTGYAAALMAEMVGNQGKVTTIDVQPDVIEQTRRLLVKAGYGGVAVLLGDGFLGCPERQPFDRIVGAVCCPDISPHWIRQLAQEGSMLLPLEHGGPSSALLMKLSRENGGLVGRVVGESLFMSMEGEMSTQSRWVRVNARPSLEVIQRLAPLPDIPPRHAKSHEATLSDFHYFLALEDRRACKLVNREVGLWDETRGFVLSSQDADQEPVTLLCGDVTLYQEYYEIFERWSQNFGRPKACDFVSEFKISEVENASTLGRVGDHWVVGREFCRQLVSLPGCWA